MTLRKILPPLTVILACAVVLFGIRMFLRPIAAENSAAEQLTTMQTLLPDSKTFVPEEYRGDDPNITALYKGENGYVIETMVSGYTDSITLWVGVSESGSVTGLTIRDIAETRGLGQRALNHTAFLEQYLATSGNADTDALSGATVTSKAITKAVNSAAAYISGADISSGATEWSK